MSTRALLTIEEAAAELKVSIKACRKWIASGELAAVKVGPKRGADSMGRDHRQVRIPLAAVSALIEPLGATGD